MPLLSLPVGCGGLNDRYIPSLIKQKKGHLERRPRLIKHASEKLSSYSVGKFLNSSPVITPSLIFLSSSILEFMKASSSGFVYWGSLATL